MLEIIFKLCLIYAVTLEGVVYGSDSPSWDDPSKKDEWWRRGRLKGGESLSGCSKWSRFALSRQIG